jgi:hypothetical protein
MATGMAAGRSTTSPPEPAGPELARRVGGDLEITPHRGQARALRSRRPVVAVIAGTQSGKTTIGPLWLLNEIRARGPGEYLVAAPTFKLLDRKAGPEFQRLFEQRLRLGKYSKGREFVLSARGRRFLHGTADPERPTTVYFGHADEPESLEAMTVKGAWLDEAGQKRFRLGSWEAIQRRRAVHRARCLITTTPYDLGWLKAKVWDRWRAGDPGIDVIRFESTANPAFPREEFERARAELPKWKFDLFYRAIFTRPAGLIYDAFDEARHVCRPFPPPADWPRYLGLDFGGVNTAAVFYAADPARRRLVAYRQYHAGGRTAAQHVAALLRDEPPIAACIGGSRSEEHWRREYRAAGLDVRAPDQPDVEVGIDRVYACHKAGTIFVQAHLDGYLDEKLSYSREVDADGRPTAKIDAKESYHLMDAERYILGTLMAPAGRRGGYDAGGGYPSTEPARSAYGYA